MGKAQIIWQNFYRLEEQQRQRRRQREAEAEKATSVGRPYPPYEVIAPFIFKNNTD